MDELRTNARACYKYRESSILVVTETWLNADIPYSLIELEGFSAVQADRNENSGKSRGGGICMYVSDAWCSNYSVRMTVCNTDVELLSVSLRPFYLPREFGSILICAVYVPPSGNAARAAAQIADCVQQQLNRTPGAPVFEMGGFNNCKLELSLPGYEQYVKCATHDSRGLDKCYGNIKSAYSARPNPPLSNSDHNTVHLIPTYKSVLKSSKPQIKTVSVWSKDSVETLKGSLLCTNWDVFYNSDIDVAVDTITDYLKFCVDCVVPKKEVKVYPNNKPYISKDVKDCINRKKTAFKNRDSLGLKIVQKELNQKLRDARKKHKDIIEQNFISMDPKKLWDSMKAAANMTTTRRCLVTDDEFTKANELNDFFMRFETGFFLRV